MRTSEFLGLSLPELPDEADIRVISNDLDTVDGAIEDLSESTAAAGRDIEALETALGNKVDKVNGKTLSTNDFTDVLKNKLDGIEAQANKYVHPTTSGNKHIPSGGSSGKILKWSADGTAQWDDETTYSDATTSAHGLMSATDKTKLNGIAENANNYVHPTTSGNKHIPSGGSSGKILKWSADGTAEWGDETQYSDATTSAHGLMSAADKTKLNGIEAQANKTVVDNALSSSSTNPVQNKVIYEALENLPYMSVITEKEFESNSGYCFLADWTKNLFNTSLDYLKKLNSGRTWNGNTASWRGVNYTINDDGSIRVYGTNNGTNTSYIYLTPKISTDDNHYIIGCDPHTETPNTGLTYRYYKADSSWGTGVTDTGNGTLMTSQYPTCEIAVQVPVGATVDFTMYPMFGEGTTIQPVVPYTGYTITSSNADGTENDSVFVSTETESPVMLRTYDGETHITAPAEVKIVIPDNEQAETVTKAIEHASNDGLLNKAECSPFAHHVTGGRTAQGFCVYNYNGVNYAACAACKTTTVLTSTLTIYNLTTGDVVQTVTSELFDHMNDMTYYDGCLYIVNGNSTDKVIVCDLSDYSVSEITVTGYGTEELHGIEYYNGNFYVLTTGTGVVHLHKYDIELSTILLTRELYRSDGFSTTQGIFAYGDYIFFLRGQNNREIIRPYVNSMRAYKIEDFTPVKTIYVPYGTELEAVSYIDGDFYFYYNTTSFVGVIYKGTLLEGDRIYGTENLSELIGFGRFEKSDSIYINESYTGFFVNNTPERPFTSWAEANTYMVNPNTPRYNVYLLSDMTTGIAIHPSINSYIYVYGAELVNGNVQNVQRSILGSFAVRNANVIGCYYLKFTGSGTCEFLNDNYVRFDTCVIDRTDVTVNNCNRLVFDSTSINYVISLAAVSNLTLSGTYESIDSAFNPNRLVGNMRVETLPTNLPDGWKPIANSITGDVYVSSVDICKKLLGINMRTVDAKTLSNSDVIADLTLPGRYFIGTSNSIVDAPTTNAGFLELAKGSNDGRRRYVFTASTSAKSWERIINEAESYDSGWIELFNDTKPNISLFEKVGVIGDSFASGETYTSGSGVDYYNISWLQILARQNGFTGTNYSKGGLTSKTWLTDAMGLPLLQSNPAENLYLIALGINDANHLTLGTVADIGTEADTFYAYYSKIISEIKTKSSKARIICLSTARFGGDYDTFSDAIQTIAEQMNVPFVDIKKHPYFKTAFYTDNQVSSHPTALNYSAMASAYKELIEGCMKDHRAYFNNYVPVTSA